MFGARCSTELTSDITHVVAAKVSATIFIIAACTDEFMQYSEERSRLIQPENVVVSRLSG